MTKSQIKSKLKKLLAQLDCIKDELADLSYEVEDTRDSIEPYEYADYLTPEQEERQEWLEDCSTALDEVISDLEEVGYKLEDFTI